MQQQPLIRELMLYKFVLGCNAMKAAKSISAWLVDFNDINPSGVILCLEVREFYSWYQIFLFNIFVVHNMKTQLSRWFKRFNLGYKNLDNQARQGQVGLKQWIRRLCFKNKHTEGIRQAYHLIVKYGLSPSGPKPNYPELPKLHLMLPKYYKIFDSTK